MACGGLSRQQLAQHVRQYAAMPVVIDLDRGINPRQYRYLASGPVASTNRQDDVLLRLEIGGYFNIEFLVSLIPSEDQESLPLN